MTRAKKSELPFQSVTSLQRSLRDGSLDPHDVLDSVLIRIRHHEPKVNAFITQIPEEALRTQADEAARSLRKGKGKSPPLTGIPIAVKDNTYVMDVRCTAGSKILADYVPKEDAPAVSKLRRAGAIILGKTNMHEFAYGVTTNNPHYGPTRNPWSLDCIAGGSSGGSAAALAAGFAFAATGTDTGGSIRIPSAICGVSGLKPTYGLVSTAGVVPLSWTLDHVGPMARFASDIALLLQIMSTSGSVVDEKKGIPHHDVDGSPDDGPSSLAGIRLGIPGDLLRLSDPKVAASFDAAIDKFRELGATVQEVEMPYFKNLDSTFLAIISAEASAYHERWVRNGRLGEYGTDVRARIHVGFPLLATQYLKAQRARAVITESFARLLRGTVDILATPTITVGTPVLGQESVGSPRGDMPVLSALTLLTRPFNLIGFPAISVPCGFVEGRLPTGLQLAAAPLREALLMHAAASFQEVTDFHTQIPPLA